MRSLRSIDRKDSDSGKPEEEIRPSQGEQPQSPGSRPDRLEATVPAGTTIPAPASHPLPRPAARSAGLEADGHGHGHSHDRPISDGSAIGTRGRPPTPAPDTTDSGPSP